jgi:hypothetical protein
MRLAPVSTSARMIPTANSSTKRNLTPPCSSAVRIAVRVTRCGILRPISKLSTVGFETFARSARSLWDQFNHARAARLCSGVTVYALCPKSRTFVLLVVSLEGRPGKTTTKPPSAMAVRPVFRSNRTVLSASAARANEPCSSASSIIGISEESGNDANRTLDATAIHGRAKVVKISLINSLIEG